MACKKTLATRIRTALTHREAVTEKKMFGELTLMVDAKMCCGILRGNLTGWLTKNLAYVDASYKKGTLTSPVRSTVTRVP